jgi:hypothetical protein
MYDTQKDAQAASIVNQQFLMMQRDVLVPIHHQEMPARQGGAQGEIHP